MALVSWALIALAALALAAVLVLLVLYLRRSVLQRDGGFDMCVRAARGHDGWAGGWTFGIGRYRGMSLEWFRTFSFTPWPKRTFDRTTLVVHDRRQPDADESYELPAGHVVLVCANDDVPVEVSMSEAAATAFLAWLEAAPPGGQFAD